MNLLCTVAFYLCYFFCLLISYFTERWIFGAVLAEVLEKTAKQVDQEERRNHNVYLTVSKDRICNRTVKETNLINLLH